MDDTSPERLLLSNAKDFDRVDEVRAGVDAILIGATNNASGQPPSAGQFCRSSGRPRRPWPAGVPPESEHHRTGDLDPSLKFWHHGGQKLVFTVDTALEKLRAQLGGLADVVSTGAIFSWEAALDELGQRGVRRLMVEGGATVHTQLMAAGLADELHLAIAPLLVGQKDAPKFLGPADYPGGSTARMRLLEARVIGDVVLLRYAPKERF